MNLTEKISYIKGLAEGLSLMKASLKLKLSML